VPYIGNSDVSLDYSSSNPVQMTVDFLNNNSKKTLFLTTSTRYPYNTGYDLGGHSPEVPRSTLLALHIKSQVLHPTSWIDVPRLNILPCEGNVSHASGNTCGVKDAILKDKKKNPSGLHRCWASVNDNKDELWRISREIFESDAVIFFASIRWGSANAEYQKLIERLTWMQNMHTTLGGANPIEGKNAGFICIGHNWNGKNESEKQKEVLSFYGFETPSELTWSWQYTQDVTDETQEGYKKDSQAFHSSLGVPPVQGVVESIKINEGAKYIGSCIDVNMESGNRMPVCDIFTDATSMAQKVGNPDEGDVGDSTEITREEFMKFVGESNLPKNSINGRAKFYYISKHLGMDIPIDEAAIFFVYNETQDVHYFFSKK
jgi:multimeric flavodoxin WrbA